MTDMQREKTSEKHEPAFHQSIIQVLPGSMANLIPKIVTAHNLSIAGLMKKYKSTKQQLQEASMLVQHYKSLCFSSRSPEFASPNHIPSQHEEREQIMKEYLELIEGKNKELQANLTSEKAKSEKLFEECSSLKRTITLLQTELKSTSSIINKQRTKVLEAEDTVQALKSRNPNTSQEIENLDKWKREIRLAECKKLGVEIEQFSACKQQLFECQQKNLTFQREINRLAEELAQSREKVQGISNSWFVEKNKLESLYSEKERVCEQLKQEIESLKARHKNQKSTSGFSNSQACQFSDRYFRQFSTREEGLFEEKTLGSFGEKAKKQIDCLRLLSHQVQSLKSMLARIRMTT
jgi:chromosome segregation ATPase